MDVIATMENFLAQERSRNYFDYLFSFLNSLRGIPKGVSPFGKRSCCCRTKIKRQRDLLSDKQHSLRDATHTYQTAQTRSRKVIESLRKVYEESTQSLLTVYAKSMRSLLAVYAKFTENLQGIYNPSTRNLQGIYNPSTACLQRIYNTSTAHLQLVYIIGNKSVTKKILVCNKK